MPAQWAWHRGMQSWVKQGHEQVLQHPTPMWVVEEKQGVKCTEPDTSVWKILPIVI